MAKKYLCLFLSLFLLTTVCGCKKNTADEYSSTEVEVIYEVEESSQEQTAASSQESSSSNNSTVKKPQKDTSSSSSTEQPVASSAPSTPTTVPDPNPTGKNSRPYLGSATVADGRIDVNDGHLYFSPYNWYNGGSYRLNTVCGGYLKVAFTGSYLAIGVDDSNIGSNGRASFEIHGYIDGVGGKDTPIVRTLDNASGGRIVFADNLSGGTHYATIYLSHTGEGDAWYNGAQNSLRINGVYINPGEQVVDLADTSNKVKPRRVIFYGDSITEAVGTSGAEYGYVAQLAMEMDAEYGQLGNGGMGWALGGARALDSFYIIDSKAGYWRYYFEGASRLVNDDINAGFIDGEPDAVFVNMGTNDAFANKNGGGMDSSFIKTVCAGWLPSIRAAVGSNTDIYFTVPFDYGKSASLEKRFKNALLDAVDEYKSASGDNNLHVLDLDKEGYRIVKNFSTDDIHPDNSGASQLGRKLYDLLKVVKAASKH